MLYEVMGKRIRERRKNMKLTQQELADQIDLSASFLGHIERGTRKLSVETLYAICMALDCSSDQLMETGKCSRYNVKDLLQEALMMLKD